MLRRIQAQVDFTILANHVKCLRARRRHYQGSNIAVRLGVLDLVKYIHGNLSVANSEVLFWPWRPSTQYDGQSLVSRSVIIYGADTSADYPSRPGGTATELSVSDLRRFRRSNAAASSLAANTPRAIGAVCAVSPANAAAASEGNPGIVTFSEVKSSQVGTTYVHPVVSGTCSTTTGQPYLTSLSGTLEQWMGLAPHAASVVQILSGADAGLYFVRHVDRTYNRLHLINIDGTAFSASATASGVTVSFGTRMAFFNEVGVIPNSAGQVEFDGVFDPGANRASYIYRIRFEKSGSPSPSIPEQTGTYWFGIRPFHFGTGGHQETEKSKRDDGMLSNNRIIFDGTAATVPGGIWGNATAGWVGGCPGVVLDETNQRLWAIATDGTDGSIAWWTYKSPEQCHEVATTSGTPNDLISGITMTGAIPRALDIGSDDTVYIALSGGSNAGWVKITSGLVATQVLSSGLALGTACDGLKVDTTRARTGTAGDVTTGTGTNTVDSASGAFTNVDIGRAIVLTGVGADNGTYLIASAPSGTQVTVTELDGSPVTFAGNSGGTFEIGDRIYLVFDDTTSSPSGTITYFESPAFGTKLTRSMGGTPVNGAQLPTWDTYAQGMAPPIAVDPSNGVVYWASDDTTNQVNRYDPLTNTWSRRLLSDFNGLNGGTGTISNPTRVNCLGVNPHASFRELWVGTDNGWVKLDPDSFAGAFSRYYGNGSDTTPYSKPAGYVRCDGSPAGTGNANSRNAFAVYFGPDGRAYGANRSLVSSTVANTQYHREGDYWAPADEDNYETVWVTVYDVPGYLFTPYGEIVAVMPAKKSTVNSMKIYTTEIHYQWIGSAWTAKEAVRGAIPDTTTSPGLSAKDLHTTSAALLHGVRVKFTPQGGATPANNEFLGRGGVTGANRADGATTISTNTFDGSGFSAGDVGKYVRIHGGADAGVYIIATYVNTTRVTLKLLNPGSSWTASATASGLTYSVWDLLTDGPESATAVGAWGIARDNTQDITNIIYEFFLAETVLSDQVETPKFMVPTLGPEGSAGPSVYFNSYARVTNPNYEPGIPQGLALPGSPLTDGLQLIDGTVDDPADGTVGRCTAESDTSWYGIDPAGGTTGIAAIVDLGLDVEIGAVIVRCETSGSIPFMLYTDNAAAGGAIFNLHKVVDGTPPAAASTVRDTGTGLSLPGSSTTVTLSAGDFLGTLTTSNTDGSTAAATNRFSATSTPFVAGHVGQVLKVTSGSDAGAYRITAVDGGGAWCDVQNLDQSAKTFSATASGLSWEVRDAVREDDILGVPATTRTHKLTVERLLTSTTAQVRTYATAVLSAQTWDALEPSWEITKRASYSVEADPPDVEGNGTYVCPDGFENCDDGSFKVVWDLSDLSTAQKTGRWWKFSAMPRFAASAGPQKFDVHAIELYDTSGNLVTVVPYQKLDTVDSQPDFMAAHATRIDILQADDGATSHVANTNGVGDLGGTDGDTITLAGSNKFLGYEVRQGASGSAVGGNNEFDCAGSDPGFISSDIGRFLRVAAGANAGYYRITGVPSSTQVTLTSPAGNPVTLNADAGPSAFAVHEGIAAGTNGDYITITTGGVGPTTVDWTISALSDDLTTITIAEKQYTTLSSQNWEIRRRCAPSDATTTDATMYGRLLYTANAHPRQSGDIAQDSRGHVTFWADDIGANTAKTDGQTTISTDTFNGTNFTPDDVGRVIVIQSGADIGAYEIDTYVGTTQVTLKNLYDGSAVSFAASASSLSYYKTGERRFRMSRYATVLRN